jgi:hypothetical protein
MSAKATKKTTKAPYERERRDSYEHNSAFMAFASVIWDAEEASMMHAIRVVTDPSQVSYDRAFLKTFVRAIKNAEAQKKHPATDRDVCALKIDPRYLNLIRGGHIYQADRNDINTVIGAIVLRNQ